MTNIGFTQGMSGAGIIGFILIIAWSLFWKGLGLWHACKRDEKKWFVFILVLNTFGILEIIYLFHFVKLDWKKPW